jgi:hypothetical protein
LSGQIPLNERRSDPEGEERIGVGIPPLNGVVDRRDGCEKRRDGPGESTEDIVGLEDDVDREFSFEAPDRCADGDGPAEGETTINLPVASTTATARRSLSAGLAGSSKMSQAAFGTT